MKLQSMIASVGNYYDSALAKYGSTPKGVDWNNENSQLLRFQQLSKIIKPSSYFSINDIGCGYGAYNLFLKTTHDNYTYYGIDISEKMIDAAKERNSFLSNCHFEVKSKPSEICDYSIASGIFNVKLSTPEKQWVKYVKEMIMHLNNSSRLGFSFNCLTIYSDVEKMKDHLFYADPLEIFNFCKLSCSLNVALLHDYDLYEFTILVRK